ncbi:MAG TPA: transporter substrate-binding domain-containing protein [Firmicutes bacterium]|nr:transporter substrate-binding domain-containing protein [Bacillota bacterium]
MKKKLFSVAALAMAFAMAVTGCSSSEGETTTGEETTDGETAEDDNVLTVAMECGYAPYNWTQPTDANGAVQIKDSPDYAYGYDVMMAKHIAEELGMELEIVKLDWDSLVPAVQSGTVDCVIAGQSITAERQEMVDFTEPYYYATIVTLTKNDSPYASATSVADLAGATCTSQQNTIWYDICLPQIPDANILPAQESAPAMLVALDSGRCDIVVTDQPTGLAATVAYPDFELLDFTGTEGEFEVSDEEINIGISLQKGNTELCDKINSVLSTMTAEDFEEMMNEAIAVQPLSE